jgi:hypothetical protein
LFGTLIGLLVVETSDLTPTTNKKGLQKVSNNSAYSLLKIYS